MTDMIIMHMHKCILYVCVYVGGSVDVDVRVDTERCVDHMQIQAHHASHYRRTITPTVHPRPLHHTSYVLYAISCILYPV